MGCLSGVMEKSWLRNLVWMSWEHKHQHQTVQSGPSWRIYITENTPFEKRWLSEAWQSAQTNIRTWCRVSCQNSGSRDFAMVSLRILTPNTSGRFCSAHLQWYDGSRWVKKKREKYNWWNTKITSASILSVLCSVVEEPGSCHPTTLQQMCHITCLLNPIHTDWGFTEEQSSASSFIFTFYVNEVTNVTSGSSECYSRWTVFLGAESLETEEPWKLIMKKVNGRRPWLAFGPHGCSRCSQPFIRSLNISRLFQASVLRRSFK